MKNVILVVILAFVSTPAWAKKKAKGKPAAAAPAAEPAPAPEPAPAAEPAPAPQPAPAPPPEPAPAATLQAAPPPVSAGMSRSAAVEEYRRNYIWFEKRTSTVATASSYGRTTTVRVEDYVSVLTWRGLDKATFESQEEFYKHLERPEVLEQYAVEAKARSDWETKVLPFKIGAWGGYVLIPLGIVVGLFLATPGGLLTLSGLVVNLTGGTFLGPAVSAAVAPLSAIGLIGGVAFLVIGLVVGSIIAGAGVGLIALRYFVAPKEVPEPRWPSVERRIVYAKEYNAALMSRLGLTPDDVANLPVGDI